MLSNAERLNVVQATVLKMCLLALLADARSDIVMCLVKDECSTLGAHVRSQHDTYARNRVSDNRTAGRARSPSRMRDARGFVLVYELVFEFSNSTRQLPG